MAATDMEAGDRPGGYAAVLNITLPEQSSRLLAVLYPLGIKLLLSIPHLIVIAVYGIVAMIVSWIAQWIVLFTGRYPDGLYQFVLGSHRWSWRYQAWYAGLTDGYPPFSGGPDDDYPASAECAIPESSSRLLAVLRIFGFTIILFNTPHNRSYRADICHSYRHVAGPVGHIVYGTFPRRIRVPDSRVAALAVQS